MPFNSITWKSSISGATLVMVGASALSNPSPLLPPGWVQYYDPVSGKRWTLNATDAALMSAAMIAAGASDGP